MGKVVAKEGRIEVRTLKEKPAPARPIQSSKAQRRISIILLLITDIATFAIGVYAARFASHSIFNLPSGHFFGSSIVTVIEAMVAYLAIYWAYGLYNGSQLSAGGSDYRSVGNANAVGLVAAILIAGFQTGWALDARTIVPFWFCTTSATILGRFAMRRFIFAGKRHGRPVERTLILGANGEGVAIAAQLAQSPKSGSTVVAFLDDFKTQGEEPVPGIPIIGSLDDLESTIQEQCIDSVLIASPKVLKEFFARDDRALEILSQVEVQMAWGGFELLTTGLRIKEEGNVPLVVMNKTRIRGLHFVLKTVLDYIVAFIALLLLFPLFLVLAILVKLDSPGPVFHKRGVVGVGGRRFYAFKFRTMYVDGDSMLTPEMKEEWRIHGKLKEDPRITRMGKFLRKVSLDELPQLLNVLAGQMSIVGPRMITPGEMERFGRWQHSRTLVKPGMTGLWQISGRSDLNYEDRARLDIYYIRNHSIWLDLRILIMTIPAVISGRGAS
ncbi:MAG TPA: sugar transferase [Fimbriimonadaceae bacterium]|nr:sugar transferase [Fimbriimonadaceae bacterium]